MTWEVLITEAGIMQVHMCISSYALNPTSSLILAPWANEGWKHHWGQEAATTSMNEIQKISHDRN